MNYRRIDLCSIDKCFCRIFVYLNSHLLKQCKQSGDMFTYLYSYLGKQYEYFSDILI